MKPRSLVYLSKDTSDLKVCISKDREFSQVIIANKEENYILTTEKTTKQSDKDKGIKTRMFIRKIPYMRGQHVRHIVAQRDGSFLIAVSHESDQYIRILNTNYEHLELEIEM